MPLSDFPEANITATSLYNEQAEARADWLTGAFAQTPTALLLNDELSGHSVATVLEEAFYLSPDAALVEAIAWLDAPTDAQINRMNAEDATDARLSRYERQRYNGEMDEEEE
jgi:hypothetical protein